MEAAIRINPSHVNPTLSSFNQLSDKAFHFVWLKIKKVRSKELQFETERKKREKGDKFWSDWSRALRVQHGQIFLSFSKVRADCTYKASFQMESLYMLQLLII